MRAAWAIARADIARRWKALMALALLTGLAGAVVLACAAGARRTDTVYERLLAASDAYDAEFSVVGEVEGGEDRFREKVTALPMVAEHGSVAILPADEPGADAFEWGVNVGALMDDRLGRTIDTARVVQGRTFDSDEPFEATASEALMRARGLSIGDEVTFQPVTFEELFSFFGGSRIEDPSPEPVTVKIVGVWRLPHDDSFGPEGAQLVYLSPAFVRGPGQGLASLPITYVRLRGGLASFDDFAEQVRAIAGDPDAVDIRSQAELVEKVERSVDVQATALLAFAALAGLASLLVLGQAIGRHVQLGADADETLLALGASRTTRAAAQVFSVAPLAFGAAVIASVVAFAVSGVFPIGFTRPLEPAPGLRADALVLAVGALAIAALAVLRAWLSAFTVARRTQVEQVARAARAPELAARLGARASVVSGLRFATMRGRGRAAVPLGSALSGTLIGVVALIAAFTFATSFDTLLRTPAEYGWTWEHMIAGGESDEIVGPRGRALVESQHTDDVATSRVVAVRLAGRTVSVIGFQPLKGNLRMRLLSGRMPDGPDQIILASETLRRSGARVGGTVEVPARCEGAAECTKPLDVVGTFVMPAIEDAPTDEGALVRVETLDGLATTEGFTDFLINLAPGSRPSDLAAIAAEANSEYNVNAPSIEIDNLSRVRSMPFALAAALGVLALATLAHLLVTSVRRRRRDLAVLKTLGFVRGQVRATVAWLATFVVAVAIVVGIPLGIVAGRWTWRTLNTTLGLDAPAVVGATTLALGAVAALAVANLIAALPGRAAARTQPALILRTE